MDASGAVIDMGEGHHRRIVVNGANNFIAGHQSALDPLAEKLANAFGNVVVGREIVDFR